MWSLAVLIGFGIVVAVVGIILWLQEEADNRRRTEMLRKFNELQDEEDKNDQERR